jgi:hypothetical protein
MIDMMMNVVVFMLYYWFIDQCTAAGAESVVGVSRSNDRHG